MRSIGKRMLLTPDEVLRLPVNEALVIMRGQKVLRVRKYDYTNHPHAKLIVKRKASSYVPEWRKETNSVDATLQKKETPLQEKPCEEKSPKGNPVEDNSNVDNLNVNNTPTEETEIETPARVSCNPNYMKKTIEIDENMEADFDFITEENDEGGDDNVPKPKHTSIDPQSILKNKK